jgi:hypothetical protein
MCGRRAARTDVAIGYAQIRHCFLRTSCSTRADDRSRMRMLREMGTASIGAAADVIDSSRLQPISMTVARDRAADRGCTGSCDGADDVGPPGEIRGGFSFWVSQWLELRWCDRRQTPRLPESAVEFPSTSRDNLTAGAFPTRLNPALKSGAFRPSPWLLPSRATSLVSWLVPSLVFWPGPRRVSPGTCRICSRAA